MKYIASRCVTDQLTCPGCDIPSFLDRIWRSKPRRRPHHHPTRPHGPATHVPYVWLCLITCCPTRQHLVSRLGPACRFESVQVCMRVRMHIHVRMYVCMCRCIYIWDAWCVYHIYLICIHEMCTYMYMYTWACIDACTYKHVWSVNLIYLIRIHEMYTYMYMYMYICDV